MPFSCSPGEGVAGVLESPWSCQLPFCNCNSIKAKGAAQRLGASLAVRNGARQGEKQRRSADSRTLSRSGYIQGNNTLWTAGLQKCGVMIYHSVAQFVVWFLTNTPRLAPLTLRPGCISLTWPPQLMWRCGENQHSCGGRALRSR